MERLVTKRVGTPYTRPIAVISVTIDSNSEVFFILDRDSLLPKYATATPISNVVKTQVPQQYASSQKLIAGILDADGQYNIKAFDGVQAEIMFTPADLSY